ncbi:MAG: glycosyltransferase, partial [Acidimicrobiia bacterium]
LEALVTELGLERRVRFIDRYVDDAGLQDLVARADLVVIPYDSHEQICSGVLTEAVAAGRPVVATAFPHAEELLAGGAGVVVSHAEEAMAESIRRLLTNEKTYSEATHHARHVAEGLAWSVVGRQYLGLLHSIRSTVDVA